MTFRDVSKTSVLDSKLASKIVIAIAKNPNTYPTAISKELGIHVGVLNDYIRSLERYGIIRKGKRTKAQEYDLDGSVISGLWKEIWLSKFKHVEGHDLDLVKIRGILDSVGKEKWLFLSLLGNIPPDSDSNLSAILSEEFLGASRNLFEGDVFDYPELRNKKRWKTKDLESFFNSLKGLYELAKYCEVKPAHITTSDWWGFHLKEMDK